MRLPTLRRKGYWIAGTATGLAGVGIARLLAPELTQPAALITEAAGITLAIVGITILACATRRKYGDEYRTAETGGET